MTQTYLKSWKSYQEQLDQLIARGMTVTDNAKALDYLERIGYYRLSGYWFAFRERTELCCPLDPHSGKKPKKIRQDRLPLDDFRPGTTFQNAVDLYVFDKKLRLLVLDALERVEIALRVDISHSLGKHHKFAYLQPELFHESFLPHKLWAGVTVVEPDSLLESIGQGLPAGVAVQIVPGPIGSPCRNCYQADLLPSAYELPSLTHFSFERDLAAG